MTNPTKTNLGYCLYEISPQLWMVQATDNSSRSGSFVEVASYMILKLKFDANDIEEAVLEMWKSKHNSINFGIGRTMIFTFNKQTNKKVG